MIFYTLIKYYKWNTYLVNIDKVFICIGCCLRRWEFGDEKDSFGF